jgi:hypothetical protein
MDGLDELPEELQQKFKTAIIEGKIADEDFKGDPEMNHLGARGTQKTVKKGKKAESEGGSADDVGL